MKKYFALFALILLPTLSFGAANKNFTLSSVSVSVGTNARAIQLIVYGNWAENNNQSIALSLGNADDQVAKARYATVIAAMNLGKRVYISYWTNITATNYEAFIDDIGEMWTLKIVD